MIRLGVASLRQLRRLRGRAISVPLAIRMAREDWQVYGHLFEDAVGDLRTGSGVCKTTAAGRFRRLDAETVGLLRARFAQGRRLQVHDLAASTGIASLELYGLLKAAGWTCDFTISDSQNTVYVVRMGRVQFLLDAHCRVVQYTVAGMVLATAQREGWHYPLNRFTRWLLDRRWRPQIEAQARRLVWNPRMLREECEPESGLKVAKETLLHPAVLREIETDPCLRAVEQDVMAPLTHAYDVVRAMNILQRNYFDDLQLSRAVSGLREGLSPDGVLIVGRTGREGETQATAFGKSVEGLTVLQEWGGGSEIRDLVLARPGRNS